MKRQLAFLAIFLPLCLLAQGFGSFYTDLPFLAGGETVAFNPGGGSISNISHWWFAGDLTNGNVTYWDDRVSGKRATNNGVVSFPVKDTNGVHFPSANGYLGISGNALVANNVLNSQSNWMIAVIFRPYTSRSSTANTSGGYTELISRVSPALDFQHDYAAGASTAEQPKLHLNATYLSAPYNNSGWQTVILVNSNTPNQGMNVYTNGVLSSIVTTQYFNAIDEFGRMNLDAGGNNEIGEASIQEILIYTNSIDMTPYLGGIQTYVSNTYPNQNYSSDVEFVVGETLGTTMNNFTGSIGYYFVPFYNMTVTELGRWDNSGNNQSHTLTLKQKWDGTQIASVSVTCTGSLDYKYGAVTPVTLTAHREYMLQSSEANGLDTWRDRSTTFMTNYYPEGAIRGYVINNVGTLDPFKGWGPLNFKYH